MPGAGDRHSADRTAERLRRRETGHFSLVHSAPVVLYSLGAWEVFDPASALWTVVERARPPVHLLVGPTWTLEIPETRAHHADQMRALADRFDGLTLTTCCNTSGEVAALALEGLASLHCSQNALVREDLFRPLPARAPVFDALYDAKWTDYKRHHLAGRVQSLGLLAGPSGGVDDSTAAYSARAMAAVTHATWLRRPWPRRSEWLSVDEVNALYNQARVGLCLSAVEGAMYASVQYLLAGLPVVTTRNLGGRDEFFDPAYTRWVDDEPDAVAAGVAELIRLDLDPWAIREATLARAATHRARFVAWMQERIEAAGGEPGRWAGGWPAGLPNKLIEPVSSATEVIAQLEG